jgi:UDP-arabinose 4-epimerase
MKILVTGGAGYVGSHICKLLRQHAIDHLAYDDFSTGHAAQLHTTPYVKGDITDHAATKRCIADYQPDTIIHTAALATIPDCTANPARTRAVNVDATKHLLECLRENNIPAIVFASTCAVYDASFSSRPFTESDALKPSSTYGQSKLDCEALLKEYHEKHNINFAALRIFNVSGAHPDGDIGEDHSPETHLIPLVIRAAYTQTPLKLFGNDYPTHDGTPVRDYVHVSDIAEAMLLAARKLHQSGGAMLMNTGSGIPTSVLQIIDAIERHSGKTIPYTITPRREGDAPFLLGDNRQLQAQLGFTPRHSTLDTIIETAWHWHSRALTN